MRLPGEYILVTAYCFRISFKSCIAACQVIPAINIFRVNSQGFLIRSNCLLDIGRGLSGIERGYRTGRYQDLSGKLLFDRIHGHFEIVSARRATSQNYNRVATYSVVILKGGDTTVQLQQALRTDVIGRPVRIILGVAAHCGTVSALFCE